MQPRPCIYILAGVVLGLIATRAEATQVEVGQLVSNVESNFLGRLGDADEIILGAAKDLFGFLATVSLVWTMGLQILRQDIGEAMMELLRFMIVTGTMYWLLVNASDHAGGEGFVNMIVETFYQMNLDDEGRAFRNSGNSAVRRALDVYLKVINDTSEGDEGDRIVGGIMGIVVLIVLTLLAAQFLLALTMAWFLGYGGIFLLGFGGARWSSQIAINYYKHVVALGVAILALSVVGLVSESILGNIVPNTGLRAELPYASLGEILVVSVLMLVLGLRVPQLLYTLVTGSSLGLFAGTAGMVGSAIAAGGGAAFASVGGGLATRDRASGSGEPVSRSSSAMEAVERSAVSASGMADPFHVAGGSDPFGVPRRPDSHRGGSGGSVFGASKTDSAAQANVSPGVSGTIGRSAAAPAAVADGSIGGEVAGGSSSGATGGSVAATVAAPVSTAMGTAGRADAPASGQPTTEPEEASQPDYTAEMSAIAARRLDNLSSVSESNDATIVDDSSVMLFAPEPPADDGAGPSAMTLQEAGMNEGMRVESTSPDPRGSTSVHTVRDGHGPVADAEVAVVVSDQEGYAVGTATGFPGSLAPGSAGIADESAPTGAAIRVVTE
jgi:P-type conjugative transfer protein TrbL